MKKLILLPTLFLFLPLAFYMQAFAVNLNVAEKADYLIEEASQIISESKEKEDLFQASGMILKLVDLIEKDRELRIRFRDQLRQETNIHKKKVLIETLKHANDSEVVAILIKLLNNEDPRIKGMAISELGAFNSNVTKTKLISLAQSDESPKMRILATYSLERMEKLKKKALES